MKLKHTKAKKANRSFDTSATGFMNEAYRKHINKVRMTREPDPGKFTKPKRGNNGLVAPRVDKV
jgi:hypothetical protein